MRGFKKMAIDIRKKTIHMCVFEKSAAVDLRETFKGKLINEKYRNICCDRFLKLINDLESPNFYLSRRRHFYFLCEPKGYLGRRFYEKGFTIFNCPMCGVKFEPNLTSKWFNIIEKKFKVDEWRDPKEYAKIDIEYLTEEWWFKQRHKFKSDNDSLLERFKKQMRGIFKGQDFADVVAEEIEKTANLGNLCCTRLWDIAYNGDDCPIYVGQKCIDYPIEYVHSQRLFRLTNIFPGDCHKALYRRDRRQFRKLFYNIFHCPLCGKKLPENLSSRWYKEIHEKFGVYDILSKSQMAKVPQKYLTEEWWKELGL